MRLFLLGVVVAGLATGSAGAQQESYFEGPSATLPDSLSESFGEISIRVSRRWGTARQKDLLERAERLYPPPSAIDAAAAQFLSRHESRGRWPQNFEEAAEIEGARWWWHHWSWVLLPYALTGGAVEHFVQQMRQLAAEGPPPGRRGEEAWHEGTLEYRAQVAELDGEYVVEMEARWGYRCGELCGLWFTHTRRVVFSADGEVLSIEGDGEPSYLVS